MVFDKIDKSGKIKRRSSHINFLHSFTPFLNRIISIYYSLNIAQLLTIESSQVWLASLHNYHYYYQTSAKEPF